MAGCDDALSHVWPELGGESTTDSSEFLPIALHLALSTDEARRSGHDEDLDAAADPQAVADTLVEAAHRQAADIRRQVREQAAAEAHKEFEAAVQATTERQVSAFEQAREQLLEELRAAYEGRLSEIEQELLSLVTAMAEKVIRRKLETDPDIVLDVVRETLEQAAGANQVTIRVSPVDEPLVREAQQQLLAALGPVDDLRIVADEQTFPGGCLVETERGRFDARIDTQLQLLSDEMDRLLKAG